jgi:hypothetical protein
VRSPTTVILRGWVKDARVCLVSVASSENVPCPTQTTNTLLGEAGWGRYLRVPARRCCWSERSEHANPDMAAGVVLGRSSTLTGRVDSLCRLLAKLRPCRALRAPGRLSKAHRSRTPPSGLPSRSARPHHTDESIGQCSDDLGAPRYHPSLSLTRRLASMAAGSTAPRPARRAA